MTDDELIEQALKDGEAVLIQVPYGVQINVIEWPKITRGYTKESSRDDKQDRMKVKG